MDILPSNSSYVMTNIDSMQSVTLSVNELLKIISGNRDKHDRIYEAAVSGYWKQAESILKEKLTKIQSQEKIDGYLGLTFPENHRAEYDKAMEKLKLTVVHHIALNDAEFSCYVMNQWGWRSSFLNTNTQYITGMCLSGVAF